MATEKNTDAKEVVSEDAAAKKTAKPKWSLKKKLAVIGGSIVGLVVLLVIVANMATSAPLKASDDFISSIRNVNANAAYNLFSSDAKEVVDQESFKAVVDQIGPILTGIPTVTSKEVSAETGADATAVIVYEIKGNDGNTYDITVNLVNENDTWKVLNFDSDAR